MTATATPRPAHALEDEDVVEGLFQDVERTTDEDERRRLREEVVLRTTAVADSLARRYVGRGIDTQDLTQVARTALVVAVTRYRCGAGRGFLAFAVPTITGELKRHFRDCGWSVRPPRRLQELRAEVSRAEEWLQHDLGREPTSLELADGLGVDVRELGEARTCGSGFRPASLEAPTRSGTLLGGTLSDDRDEMERWVTSTTLHCLLGDLCERDRLILVLRFEENRTQEEIGLAIGVSQMQVSRLLSRILGRLRAGLESEEAP